MRPLRLRYSDGRCTVDRQLVGHSRIDRADRTETGGLTREAFPQDPVAQDATAYRLLAIGEAAGDPDDNPKSCHAHIPWWQILGMRNILAHEYFIRESEIIWETLKTGLPELAAVCRTELARLGWNQP